MKGAGAASRIKAFLAERRGGVSTMLALMLIPLVGIMGAATEASSWFLTQRAAQNAADSASMAAAINACASTDTCHTTKLSATYDQEAASVATQFGFTNGASNTTVATVKETCPADATKTCYQVTITRSIPLYLVRIVGYSGGDGSGIQKVSAIAVAEANTVPHNLCLLALGTGSSLTSHGNGSASIQFTGCSIGTNGNANCTGHDLNADATYAAGTIGQSCSLSSSGDHSGAGSITDPYASWATKSGFMPTCSGSTSQTWNSQANANASGGKVCGNLTIAKNVAITLTASQFSYLLVGGNITFQNGASLTLTGLPLILSGTGGGLNLGTGNSISIAAPTSGTWDGVAIYQNPTNPTVSWDLHGNAPTLNISGLIYLPKTNLTLAGTVNKANGGFDCFIMVTNTFDSNGTTNINEKQTQCSSYGLNPPTGATIRQTLVE